MSVDLPLPLCPTMATVEPKGSLAKRPGAQSRLHDIQRSPFATRSSGEGWGRLQGTLGRESGSADREEERGRRPRHSHHRWRNKWRKAV